MNAPRRNARRHALGVALATLALACGPGDPAAEARADSAAAGYDVGAARTPATSAPAGSAGDPAPPSSPEEPGAHPLVRPVPPATPPRLGARTADSAAASASGAAGARAPASGPLADPRVTSPGGAPSVVPVAPPESARVPVGRVRLSEQIEFDAGERTVWLRLVHAQTDANDGLNIDGRSRGAMTIVVPLGWRVEATTQNRDDQRPHSAVVIEGEPHPGDALTPAFTGASTPRPGGIVQGERGTLAFTASRAGRYAIACGVEGHAEGGEWITLRVETAAVPAQR